MLTYETRGEGPLVVLLHSGGMSGRQWRSLSDHLSGAYRVAAPDFLGSGKNPPWPPEEPFDFRMDVAAIVELVASFGERAHFVGHSYGGLIALTVAVQHPELVRTLATYDPVAFGTVYEAGDAAGMADLSKASENPIFLDDEQGGGDAWFEAFVDYWNGPGSWKALPAPTRSSFLRVGKKVYREVRSLMSDRTPASAYGSIHVPTLLLGGERSPMAAQRVRALLAAAIPNATSTTVEGAGHMGPITHASRVNALLSSHIGR